MHDYDIDVIAIELKNVTTRVARLVREKAWEEREGGWFITGWFNWNESVAALRDAKRRKVIDAAKTNHGKHTGDGVKFRPGCLVCMGEVEA